MIILVFILYALFASIFTIEKTALLYSQPIFLIGSRMFFAGILLLAYQYFFRSQEFKFPKRLWSKIFLLSFFNIYLTNIFEILALSKMSSYKTCFFYNMIPFISAIFSYYLFADRLSFKKFLGLVIGFVGFIPLLLSKVSDEEMSSGAFFLTGGEFIMPFAVVCSAYGWIVLKQLVDEEKYPPLMANGISMFLGGFFALIHSVCIEEWAPVPVTHPLYFLECTLLLLLVSNLVCYNLYGYLLKRFSATLLAFAGFTTPMFTALFGWFFLGESVSIAFYISATIVFWGLWLFSREENANSKQLVPLRD